MVFLSDSQYEQKLYYQLNKRQRNLILDDREAECVYLNFCSFNYEQHDISTKTLGVVGQGSGWQNSIPTIPTIPTVPTIPTFPTPWECSKLNPVYNFFVKLDSR